MKKYNVFHVLHIWLIFVLCFTGVRSKKVTIEANCSSLGDLRFHLSAGLPWKSVFELDELKVVCYFRCALRENWMYVHVNYIEVSANTAVWSAQMIVVWQDRVLRLWPLSPDQLEPKKTYFPTCLISSGLFWMGYCGVRQSKSHKDWNLRVTLATVKESLTEGGMDKNNRHNRPNLIWRNKNITWQYFKTLGNCTIPTMVKWYTHI